MDCGTRWVLLSIGRKETQEAAKKSETPFLRIGFALLAPIQSGCFSGRRHTSEGAAERVERRRKIRLRFFHLSPFFGHLISFLRIGFAFLAAIQSGFPALPCFPMKLKAYHFM
jgi:hypothetical protein